MSLMFITNYLVIENVVETSSLKTKQVKVGDVVKGHIL